MREVIDQIISQLTDATGDRTQHPLYLAIAAAVQDSPDDADDLARFARSPDRYEDLLRNILRMRLSQDPALLAKLRSLLGPVGGSSVSHSHDMSVGDNARVGQAIAGDVHGGITMGDLNFGDTSSKSFNTGGTIGSTAESSPRPAVLGESDEPPAPLEEALARTQRAADESQQSGNENLADDLDQATMQLRSALKAQQEGNTSRFENKLSEARQTVERLATENPDLPELSQLFDTDNRVFNVWVEGLKRSEPLKLQQTYDLKFNVDAPRADARAKAGGIQTIMAALPAEQAIAKIQVAIHTDDFTIYSSTEQTLFVPRTGKSKNELSFTIEPIKDGRGVVEAWLSTNGNVFQKMQISLQVGQQTAPVQTIAMQSRGFTIRSALRIPTRPGERAIDIEIAPQGSYYQIKLKDTGVVRAELRLTETKVAQLLGRARHTLKTIVYAQAGLNYAYQGTNTAIPAEVHAASLKMLAELGHYLFQELFYAPDNGLEAQRLGQLLRQLSQEQELRVQIDADHFIFPWALLYDRHPLDLDHVDPMGFWGFKHIIEYLPQFRIPPVDFVHTFDIQDTLHIGFVFNTTIDEELSGHSLGPVVQPQRDFLKTLAGASVSEHPNREDLYTLLKTADSSAQLLYLYCHAESKIPGDWGDVAKLVKKDAEHMSKGQKPTELAGAAVTLDVDSSWLKLSDGEARLLDLKQNAPIDLPPLKQAPLVFLNACQGAELSPYLYDGLIPYLLAKGVRGVLGTEVDTPMFFAAEFAQLFLTRFTEGGKPLGDLIRDLRREYLLQKNNVLGLVYALYSSGDIVVRRAN